MNALPLYSTDEILAAINKALASLGIESLPASVGEGMVLCLISLLQDVTFTDRNDHELGRIFFAFNATEVFAMAGVRVGDKAEQLVPVLRVPNRWLKLNVQPEASPEGMEASPEGTIFLAVPNYWVTIERSAGSLTVISH